MLEICETAKISNLADIEDSTRGSRIVIGEGVMIDAFVKVKCAGGLGDLRIGAGSSIASGVVIYTGNGVVIGRGVLIAANCTLAPTNHEYRSKHKSIVEQRFMPTKGGIVIEDDVWLGANCVVLDGARVRTGAVVGAGSVVRGELESFGVYAGNPLAKLGERT